MDCLGQILSVEKTRKRGNRSPSQQPNNNVTISLETRYLTFKCPVQFRCIRQGVPLPAGESPDTFRASLTYDYLYIFEHEGGAMLNRQNKDTPRFIGCLLMGDGVTYVHPQDGDFQRIYADRRDVSRAWDVSEQDGTPYWVDTHALRMLKREAKKNKKK